MEYRFTVSFETARLRRLALAGLLVLAPFTAAHGQNSYLLNAYIGNAGNNTVSVIDTATNSLTGTITAGTFPQGIAVAPDGSAAYFVNNPDNTVSVYDAASRTVTATIPVGNYPLSPGMSPDGSQLYVPNENDGSISIINTVTDTISATIPNLVGPISVTFTPDGSAAYVMTFSPSVTVIDTASHAIIASYRFEGFTNQIAFTPDGSQAYVATENAVEIIDTGTGAVTAVSIPGANISIAVRPDGSEAWAVTENGVAVIDTATNNITTTIPVGNGPNAVSFSADGTKGFVIVRGDDNVAVVDTATKQVLQQIPVGINAVALGFFIAPSPPASPLGAAVLPGGRSVEVGATATLFATILNSSADTLDACGISISGSAEFAFSYQTTDPATNALIGSPDTPVSIDANGYQTYVLSFQSSAPLSMQDLPLVFGCNNVAPAPVVTGVNTVDLLFSPVPVADIIALSATAGGNGVVTVPFSQEGAAAFAVASINAGAGGALTVTTDTGDASVPITVTLCETDPSTGQCLAPPTSTVPVTIDADATPTFSVFVTASAPVPFAPGTSRIFVRFLDAANTSHGSTSVAVETD